MEDSDNLALAVASFCKTAVEDAAKEDRQASSYILSELARIQLAAGQVEDCKAQLDKANKEGNTAVDLCQDEAIGATVKAACGKTCGLCPIHLQEKPTPPLVPSWRCKDSLATGIRFHGGGAANCSELYNYCNHETLDDHIKLKCPLTCGLCRTTVTVKQAGNSSSDSAGGSSSNSSSSADRSNTSCEDLSDDKAPVLWMGTRVMSCAEGKEFCFGHPNSKHVAKKCKMTCGVCFVADDELEDAASMDPITPAPTPVEDDAETMSMPSYDGYEGPSCSRRRRWGLCSSRRRDR